MNMNTHKFQPQASPIPNSAQFGGHRVTPTLQFQHTPVYLHLPDYTAPSPLFSPALPMHYVSSGIFNPQSPYMYLSNESFIVDDQMQELPSDMQSPPGVVENIEDNNTTVPPAPGAIKSLISHQRELRRQESGMSQRSMSLRRQRSGRSEAFLRRRYSQNPNPSKMSRDVSLRDRMSQLRGGSVLERGISEQSLTTLQMMQRQRSHYPNIIGMALHKDLSRELQTYLAHAKAYRDFRTIEILFLQLLPETTRLSKDAYANFVLQRFVEAANHGLVDQMAEFVKLSVLDMATHRYACRVLQRIITYCSPSKREELAKIITKEAVVLLQNKFGSYVLQTIIENTDSSVLEELTTTYLETSFYELSIDQYGSHIMQHVFRFYRVKDKERLTELVLGRVIELSNHIHGNYVVQKMIYFGNSEVRSRVVEHVLPHIPSLCCTKSGSNVLEKCLQNATREESNAVVEKVVENDETLKSIISDRYGNYVVQNMLKTLPMEQRIEFSRVLMEYFEKLEEAPEKNSFESFVFRALQNAKQKNETNKTRSQVTSA